MGREHRSTPEFRREAVRPAKTITVDGERIGFKNRPDVFSCYFELQGSTKPEDMEAYGLADRYGDMTMLEVLNDLVTGESYLSHRYGEAEDPQEKREFSMRIVRGCRRAAREKLIEEFPDLIESADRKRRLRLQSCSGSKPLWKCCSRSDHSRRITERPKLDRFQTLYDT